MPISERLALHLQRLARQRLNLVVLALGLQHLREVVDGDERVRVSRAEALAVHLQRLAIQRLGLVELEAQRITVLVHALAAAVGSVLLWARAPPVLEAVVVRPLNSAAAGARLHERAVLLTPVTQPALVRLFHTSLLFLLCRRLIK
eukprot:scaffold107568_cov77-Phaeocystis_antarctica.AAC.10